MSADLMIGSCGNETAKANVNAHRGYQITADPSGLTYLTAPYSYSRLVPRSALKEIYR